MAAALHSTQFDDIYFNPADGMGESQYVFLDGCDIPRAWQSVKNFHITELGFGTGLNFLLTLDAWLKHGAADGHLTYCGIDLYPLEPSVLRGLHQHWPHLPAAALRDHYPGTETGIHILYPAPNVTLMLMWGEALPMLQSIRQRQDCFYLDGFAPAKNPDMWRDDLYPELARLAKAGARVATFTAAGRVKRGLEKNGFHVTKTKGFGHKRERILARYGV